MLAIKAKATKLNINCSLLISSSLKNSLCLSNKNNQLHSIKKTNSSSSNNLLNFILKKNYSTSSSNCSNQSVDKNNTEFGIFFDIDGVLTRGKTLLPRTRDCIKIITDSNGKFKVPTLFVTNAGNELRSAKSSKLSQLLGVHVNPDQVVMSHSPLRVMNKFHNKRCLISGQGPIVEIAKNLGFKSVITVDDLRQYYPHLDVVDHKRRTFAPCVLGSHYLPHIEAIILFGESVRWETNLQLMIDVIMCNGKLDQPPKKFPSKNLPILACNTDMVWMAEAAMPRFGHGTFLHCLEQIYQKLSGNELKYEAVVGKPSEITYFFAEHMLKKHAESIGITNNLKRIYAIGDNLDTDIYGANLYNQVLRNFNDIHEEKLLVRNKINSNETSLHEETSKFSHIEHSLPLSGKVESISSILVRTGVFQGDIDEIPSNSSQLLLAHKDMTIDPSLIKPNFVSNDAYEAVKLIFKLENI